MAIAKLFALYANAINTAILSLNENACFVCLLKTITFLNLTGFSLVQTVGKLIRSNNL